MQAILGADGSPIRLFDTAHRGASKTDREMVNWRPKETSGFSELSDELGTLRNRSQDIERNHGVAAGSIQTLIDNIVGPGLRLRAMPDAGELGWDLERAKEWADDVEKKWERYSSAQTFDAARLQTAHIMAANVVRYRIICGESICLPFWLPERHGAEYSTAIRMVEPARLSTPDMPPSNKDIRQGVEINPIGEPVAYWVSNFHPAENATLTGVKLRRWRRITTRMRNGRRRVIHSFEPKRAGQLRGKPLLSPVLQRFHMLDHYERLEVQNAVLHNLISAIVETPLDQQGITELFGAEESPYQSYLAARNEFSMSALKGGAIISAFPGDTVKPFAPTRPNTAYGDFVRNAYQYIGAGLNIPVELLLKDFTQSNYSSARAALMEAWRFFMGWRKWLGAYWYKPCYELWLEEAVNRGNVDAPDFYEKFQLYTQCEWVGPGRGSIDPDRESKAHKRDLDNATSTLSEIYREKGMDWREEISQRAKELAFSKQLAEENGISFEALTGIEPTQPNEQTNQNQ